MLRIGAEKRPAFGMVAVGAAACVVALGLQGCGSGLSKALSSAASSAPSAGQSVSAPASLGYAWDSADKTLRPIVGIVGSSHVGASMVPAAAYAGGAASAVSRFGLLIHADGTLDRVDATNSSATTSPIGGVTVPANARIVFSPSGEAAIVFAPGSSVLVRVSQLTGSPQASTYTASAAVTAAAISDKGGVAVLQAQGSQTQLAVLSSGGEQVVSGLAGTGVLTFLPKTDDLLLAGSTANTLIAMRNLTTAPAQMPINVAGLLKVPAAISTSQDGRWAVVANSAESSVVRIDLTGGTAPQRVLCPVAPTMVDPLLSNAGFRFSDVGKSPAWVSDMAVAKPTMLFVPAVS